MKKIKNKKFWMVAWVAAAIVFFATNVSDAATVGLVADVHAGTKKSNKQNMDKFLDILGRIKSQGNVDTIIMLGDLADTGQTSFYAQVKDIKGVIWVKGNKDKKGFGMLDPGNYTVDFDDFRIIILDSNVKNKNGMGGLKASQIDFFGRIF
jgi:predicted phosphodiesterase